MRSELGLELAGESDAASLADRGGARDGGRGSERGGGEREIRARVNGRSRGAHLGLGLGFGRRRGFGGGLRAPGVSIQSRLQALHEGSLETLRLEAALLQLLLEHRHGH